MQKDKNFDPLNQVVEAAAIISDCESSSAGFEISGYTENYDEDEEMIHTLPCTTNPDAANSGSIVSPIENNDVVVGDSSSEKKAYKCTACPAVLHSWSSFSYHKTTRHGPKEDPSETCPTCNKVVANSICLRQHMKIHQNSFKCGLCGKLYPSNTRRNRHIKQVHQKMHGKLYACKLCGETFKTSGAMSDHLKQDHSNENESSSEEQDT